MDYIEKEQNRPANIQEWDGFIKEVGLHLKWPEQLGGLYEMYTEKLPKLERRLAEAENSPDFQVVDDPDDRKKWIIADVSQDRLDDIAQFTRKIAKGKLVMEACLAETEIREKMDIHPKTPAKYKRAKKLKIKTHKFAGEDLPEGFARNPIGTKKYIDADNGNNTNSGLETTLAFATIEKFTKTDVAAAGDVAVLRRGTTATYGSAAVLDFDEDGTSIAPILIEGDFDNEFGDDVDLSATQLATIAFGSKVVTFAGDISGVLSVGDWVYETNDNAREHCREVASVSTGDVTLYTPYKGDNAGSGKTMINIGSNPVYGVVTDTVMQVKLSSDDYWHINGLTATGNDANDGLFEIVTSDVCTLQNCVAISGDSSSSYGYDMSNSTLTEIINFRTHNSKVGMRSIGGISGNSSLNINGAFLDGNSKLGATGYVAVSVILPGFLNEIEFAGNTIDIDVNDSPLISHRNCTFSAAVGVLVDNIAKVAGEDYDATKGAAKQELLSLDSNEGHIIVSSTTTPPTNGSTNSLLITPTLTAIGTYRPIRLFPEVAIYIPDTTSRTYTVYFKPVATGDWTTDPTAVQLFLQLEVFGSGSNIIRRNVKSAGVIDMNGTAGWQALTIVFAAGQSGMAYLTGWYGKPLENAEAFYVNIPKKSTFITLT